MQGDDEDDPPLMDYDDELGDENLDEETVGSTVVQLLEKYNMYLSGALASQQITETEFDISMVMSKYELDIRSKTYVLDDIDKEQMEEYSSDKKKLEDAYKEGKINIDEFNSTFAAILRKELVILRRSESTEGTKITSKVPVPLEEALTKLQDEETKTIKKISKKYDIEFPIPPAGYSYEYIEIYYKNKSRLVDTSIRQYGVSFNIMLEQLRSMDPVGQRTMLDSITNDYQKKALENKLEFEPIPEIEEYFKKISKFRKLIDYHMDSFVLSKKIINDVNGKVDYEFEQVQSITHKFDQLKKSALETVDYLTYSEKLLTNRIKELKNKMYAMSREDLIKCAMGKLGADFSLIEKLKENRRKSFKFKDFTFKPDEPMLDIYDFRLQDDVLKTTSKKDKKNFSIKMEELIKEDLEIYGVTYEEIYEPFEYILYDVKRSGMYYFKQTVTPFYALDEESFFLILPISEKLQLQSESGNNTEVVDTWILEKPGGVTVRYLSFEKYLFQFKEQLIQELKEAEETDKYGSSNIDVEMEQTNPDEMEQTNPDEMEETNPGFEVNKRVVAGNEKFRPEKWTEFLKGKDATSKKRGIYSEEGLPVTRRKSEEKEFLKQRIVFLKESIKKINFYIEFKLSLEKSSETSQLLPGELTQGEIQEMKEYGNLELHKHINEPGQHLFVMNINDRIFSFSSLNYKKNIDKIIFIFSNYPEKLADLKRGLISIEDLLFYETPLVTPEQDLITGAWNEEGGRVFIEEDDKLENIRRLLIWKPETSAYDRYIQELLESDHDFKRFKNDHQELTHLQIKEIMNQYAEKIQWESTLSSYEKLDVPTGDATIKWPERPQIDSEENNPGWYLDYNLETNFRLRWLIKRRNQLPSRRQYILASIETRVEKFKNISELFKRCKFANAEKLAGVFESTIYTLSKSPEDYMYYNEIIGINFLKLCQNLNVLEIDRTFVKDSVSGLFYPYEIDEEFQQVEIDEQFITLVIEYVTSSGEVFSSMNFQSGLKKRIEEGKNLAELKAYVSSLITVTDMDQGSSQISSDIERLTMTLNAIQIEDTRSIEYLEQVRNANTYIPPRITEVPPSIIEELEIELFEAKERNRLAQGVMDWWMRRDNVGRTTPGKPSVATYERRRRQRTRAKLNQGLSEVFLSDKERELSRAREGTTGQAMGQSLPDEIKYRKYIRVGNNYIYGGKFPPFYRYEGYVMSDVTQTPSNYTTEDLVSLANVFGIETKRRNGEELTNLELYTSIKTFMDNYESTHYRNIIVRPVYYEVELHNEEYLKIPVKNIKYTYRPRLTVKPPGQIYPVYEDIYFKYGVPIEFNKDTIPIYPMELIKYYQEGFIKIEGPFIFDIPDPEKIPDPQKRIFDITSFMSNFYIMVEYKDFRGDVKFCREGVAIKRIQKKIPSKFFGCDRYKNEVDCNDPFSFSMETDIYDVNKKKKTVVYKCGWDPEKKICTGIIPPDEIVKEFDIESVYFGDVRDEIWRREVINFRESTEAVIKDRGIVDVDDAEEVALEEKGKLFLKFEELFKAPVVSSSVPMEEIPSIELPGESGTYSTVEFSLSKEMGSMYDASTYPPRIYEGQKGYKEVTVYTYESEIIDEEVRIKSIPHFCLVADEDYEFPSKKDKLYYWILKTIEYKLLPGWESENTLSFTYKTELITEFPPPNSIKLNPEYETVNEKRVISRTEILEAMYDTAFKTFETNVSDGIKEFKDTGINVPDIPISERTEEFRKKGEKELKEEQARLKATRGKYVEGQPRQKSEEVQFYLGIEEDEKRMTEAKKIAAANIPRRLIGVQREAIKFAIEHKIDILLLFTKSEFKNKWFEGFILTVNDIFSELTDRPEIKMITYDELRKSIEEALDKEDIQYLSRNFELGKRKLIDTEGKALMKNVKLFLKENEKIRKEKAAVAAEEAAEKAAAVAKPVIKPKSYLGGGRKPRPND